MAPTCAELDKRICGMEKRLSAVDRIEEKLATLDDISTKLEGLKALHDISNSLNFLSAKFDDLKKEMEYLKSENRKLKEENRDLWKENSYLEDRIEELDAYNRRNNLVIQNVPCGQGEDTDEIVMKISEKFEIAMERSDIEASHRLPAKKGNKPIVVRFVNRRHKEALIEKSRKATVTTKDLNFAGEINKIYLAEHLTPKKQDIFNTALAAKREVGYRYLWTKNGSVFIRKEEGSPIYKLSSKQDIRDILQGRD